MCFSEYSFNKTVSIAQFPAEDVMAGTSIQIEGKTIEIRQMDDSYILAGDMEKINQMGKYGICVADRPLETNPAAPNQYFRKIHELLLHQYGTGAFLAWENNRIVGFINFHPDGLDLPAELCMQKDHPGLLKKIDEFLPKLSRFTLRIRCKSIAPEYRDKGIGKVLLNALLEWAKTHGYRELRILCPKQDQKFPARIFWEKLGFSAVHQEKDSVEMSRTV